MSVNSKEYWDERFSNGDWEKYDGDLQSAFFSQLFVREIPEWLHVDLNRNAWIVADYGCAEGGGTAVLAREFPSCSFTGIDFSEAAIAKAEKQHPSCHFATGDLYAPIPETDVVFSSNTLEHLKNPIPVMRKLIHASRKHTIFMLPFEDDYGFPEHINRFTASLFRDNEEDHYLSFFKVIDCREKGIAYWPGKQVMLIYTNQAFRAPSDYRLADFYTHCAKEYVEEAFQKNLELKNAEVEKQSIWEQLTAEKKNHQDYCEKTEAEKESYLEQLAAEKKNHQDYCEKTEAEKEFILEQLAAEKKNHQDYCEKTEAEKESYLEQLAAEKKKHQDFLDKAVIEKTTVSDQLSTDQPRLDRQISQESQNLQMLQSQLNALQQENLALKENCNHYSATISMALCQAQYLVTTRKFKLLHLMTRIRRQLFNRNREERRLFFKWLKGRFKKLPDTDHRYNPMFEVINILKRTSCSAAAKSRVSGSHLEEVSEITAKCLDQRYEKPDVIMFSVINYDFRFQRPQHFAKRFAENGHRVFYINANFINPELIQEIEPGLFVVDFMTTNCNAIYFNNEWTDFDSWLRTKMDNLIKTYAIRDAIVVVDYPNWICCSEYLRDTYGFKLVADYMDDATGFLGTTTDVLKINCIRMLCNCDMVIPSSQFLFDIAKKYTDHAVIVRNGTEVEHFYQALSIEQTHERPVIGYYGAVSHWFDWEKVCFLAKHLPECDIVIIGSVTEHREKLECYENIKLLGEINYNNLPEHLAYFDVCLIPFDTSTDLIKATNPVKFYEYLSAGKRVVATEIPELEPFRDRYVYMSNDEEQFLAYVELCLEGKDTLASEEECISFAKENDWQHRYNAFAHACELAVPKVSVVVLTYNNLELNKFCIESILNQTAYPNYELLVVDNQSSDGTIEYLHSLEKQNHPRLKIIFNEENSGFAGGNNKAIRLAAGKYVVLLNNDTVVTRGWLTAMVKHMEMDPHCGMVGAVTNSIGNEAMIGAHYSNLRELSHFAYSYTQQHNNEKFLDIDRLALFCTMIRKDMMDKYGMLDTGYKVGMFEDDDFAMTVKQAGYHFYAIEDCYIHHVNNASFKKLHPEEYQRIFNTNRKRFEKKWNTTWTMPKYRDGVTWDINKNTMVEPVMPPKTKDSI